MTRTQHVEQPKSRQKLAEENMSKVQRIHRALQSGPVKSELRTVQESIHAASALYSQIKGAGIESTDCHVHIAYMTPDLSALFTHAYLPGEEAKVHAELSGPSACCIMVGVAFAIRDWEKENWVVGVRPFLNTPLVNTAFKNWSDSMILMNA